MFCVFYSQLLSLMNQGCFYQYEIQNQASRVSLLSPTPEHCTCIKIRAQRESLKFWTDQNYMYNRGVLFVFLFNSLVHLLRLMNRKIYLTFTELLEFTKPSGISFTLCVHIINKLFNHIFLCAGDMCQAYVWIKCLYLWSKSIKRETTTVCKLFKFSHWTRHELHAAALAEVKYGKSTEEWL